MSTSSHCAQQVGNRVAVVKSVMKTVVIMVINIEPYERGMTIEYLKCRQDLNFEVNFRGNDVIGKFVTKWDVILFG